MCCALQQQYRKDIGDLPVHKATIEKAKMVTKFIYAHSLVLCMMMSFTKGKELTRPGITRFATNYLTLRSILEAKKSLKAMFTSKEWKTCKFYRQGAAVNVESIMFLTTTSGSQSSIA